MNSARLRVVALALAVMAAPALASCADDEPVAAGGSLAAAATTSASPTPSTATFPVTISQSVGDVTIPTAPSRVVTLDFPSADAALALGVVPVAMAELSYIPGGVQSWTLDALGGAAPEIVNTEQGFPFETLLRLDPDVILATNAYPLVQDSWEQLNEIAPVVAHVREPGLDDWQDGMRKIALALGRAADGERLITEAESAAATARNAHPEFAGKTASFFNYVSGDGLYVISSNDDVSMRFVRDLGFAGAPENVTELGSSADLEGARAIVSPERYDVLDADVILGTTSGPDPTALTEVSDDPLFTRVPAVARGSFLGFGIGPATALAFPSVLSVQYAVRELVPQLAAAVAAQPTASPAASTS